MKTKQNSNQVEYLEVGKNYYDSTTTFKTNSQIIFELLGVELYGNVGYKGNIKSPQFVVLITEQNPEEIKKGKVDIAYSTKDVTITSIFTNIFTIGKKTIREKRKLPPVLAFSKVDEDELEFIGVLVPGQKWVGKEFWLEKKWQWKEDKNERIAHFTLLKDVKIVYLSWLDELECQYAYGLATTPKEWNRYIENDGYFKINFHYIKIIFWMAIVFLGAYLNGKEIYLGWICWGITFIRVVIFALMSISEENRENFKLRYQRPLTRKKVDNQNEITFYPIQYEMLKKAGNIVISREKYDQYGSENLKKHFEEKMGFKVKLLFIKEYEQEKILVLRETYK